MTPLRDNLDRAKAAYEQTRYRGSLADDVLGRSLTLTATPVARTPTRRFWLGASLALAAALAVGLGVHWLVTTRTGPTGPTVASNVHDTRTVIVTPADAATTDDDAETAFTLVPDGGSLVGDGASFVPSLTSVASGANDFSLSVPSAPMLFSLAGLVEQDEAAQTTTDSAPATGGATSEERS